MIAAPPTMSPSSSGVEPGTTARHDGGRRSTGSASSARSFERTLNDARERSDAGPRRSHGGEAGSEKARAAHRSSVTTSHATGEHAVAESDTAATTPPGSDASGTSGAGSPADAAAATAVTTAGTATAAGDMAALAAGAVTGAGLSAVVGPAGQAGATTSDTATNATASGSAAAGMPATGATVVNGVATGVGPAGLDLGAGGSTAANAGVPGRPASAGSANVSGAPVGLTITVGTDGHGHGSGVTAPSGASAAAMAPPTAGAVTGVAVGAIGADTTTTTLAGHPSAGSAGRSDPTSPTSGATLASAAVATPASGVPAPTTAPAGSATIPQWLQQAVQAQLTGRLVAAARGSEAGSVQRLTLHLHPADLGAVQVVATMDDGTVSLQLLAGNPATREALRASLGVLRSDLAAAGLDGTHLDVSDQPPGQQGTPQQQSGAWSDGSARAFTGGAAAHAMTAGRTDPGQAPSAGGADVRARPPDRSQGVDLRL